ncbi:MAG: arsenical resistance protein ArsH [Pseudomonadota bacterium]
MDLNDLPNVVPGALQPLDFKSLSAPGDDGHAPRILLLYGSLRDVSYSRKVTEEAARLLRALGCETRTFNPSGLPLPGDPANPAEEQHSKVQELRDLALWSEGMVWSSPERHGAMSGVMKTQIDWIPLSAIGGIRPTQGKTLALAQVCGGSQSFNAVNQMRILGRWMRMVTIPNQSSVAKAWQEFDGDRMKPSAYYNRLVDVMEELARFTVMTRGRTAMLTDRYSEGVESVKEVHARVSKNVS